jgi:hypothetical protein
LLGDWGSGGAGIVILRAKVKEQEMPIKNLVHLNPIWRAKANFLIGAWCYEVKNSATRDREQIWSRKILSERFEICCIPFFVYDLALGDEVETEAEGEFQHMISRVVKPSGHSTFRVWFGETASPTIREEVTKDISDLNCLMEWYSTNLLGVDAPSDNHAQALANYLHQKELIYETGRTQST